MADAHPPLDPARPAAWLWLSADGLGRGALLGPHDGTSDGTTLPLYVQRTPEQLADLMATAPDPGGWRAGMTRDDYLVLARHLLGTPQDDDGQPIARVVGGTDGPDQGDPAAWLIAHRDAPHRSWVTTDADSADACRVGDRYVVTDLIPRAPGAVAAAPPGDEAALRVAPFTVKMLREHLCSAQTGTTGHVSAVLGHLIAECDRHRPLGPDGKHGTRHTTTCGCEDTAPPAVIDPATWTVIEAHAGAVPPAPPAPPAGHEDEAAVERGARALADLNGPGCYDTWADVTREVARREVRAVLAAARGPRTPDPGAGA